MILVLIWFFLALGVECTPFVQKPISDLQLNLDSGLIEFSYVGVLLTIILWILVFLERSFFSNSFFLLLFIICHVSSSYECYGKLSYDTRVCSGNGKCVSSNKCDCFNSRNILPTSITATVARSGGARYVFVQGDFAYVISGARFSIFSINDIKHPVEIGSYEKDKDYNTFYSVFVVEEYAYVAGTLISDAVLILDISNKSSPSLVGSFQKETEHIPSFFVEGDYCYIGDNNGLSIIDMADITNLTLVGNYRTEGTVNSVFIQGEYAYLGGSSAEDYNNFGAEIIDISNKVNPSLKGSLKIGDGSQTVTVQGNTAFFISGQEFTIVDISNKSTPYVVGHKFNPNSLSDIFADGNRKFLYLADAGKGLTVFDISNKESPVFFGSLPHWPNNYLAVSLYIEGNYAFVACQDDGLLIIQVKETEMKYYGETCNVTKCFGEYSNSSAACGNHGTCYDFDKCRCSNPSKYKGVTCEFWDCGGINNTERNIVCSGHGSCIDYDVCTCNAGWASASDCSIFGCYGSPFNSTNACSGHGVCVGPNTCKCEKSYTNRQCSKHQSDNKHDSTPIGEIIAISGAIFVVALICCCCFVIICGLLLLSLGCIGGVPVVGLLVGNNVSGNNGLSVQDESNERRILMAPEMYF